MSKHTTSVSTNSASLEANRSIIYNGQWYQQQLHPESWIADVNQLPSFRVLLLVDVFPSCPSELPIITF